MKSIARIDSYDEVWVEYKKTWALMGVRDRVRLVEMLEDQLLRELDLVIEDSKREFIDDIPEAYVQREIGIEKEKKAQ